MATIVLRGIDDIQNLIDDIPDVIRAASADALEAAGKYVLQTVQHRIGGNRLAAMQEYQVGSGCGYVAVRPKANTELDGYAVGLITNALENGHKQHPGQYVPAIQSQLTAKHVAGKYMYFNTLQEAGLAANQAAESIGKAVKQHLDSGAQRETRAWFESTNRSSSSISNVVRDSNGVLQSYTLTMGNRRINYVWKRGMG